jgi:hypothetical protein
MHRRGADQLHSLTAVSNNAGAAGKGGLVPATPQRPNPELRIVDPLLISATAASASLYNFDAAVADIKSGSTILSSGFGLCGVAGTWTNNQPVQLISATAASASLYNFEPLRSTLGARDFNGVVMEYNNQPVQEAKLTHSIETLINAMHRRGADQLHSLTAAFSQSTLRTKFNSNVSRQIFLLQCLIIPEV